MTEVAHADQLSGILARSGIPHEIVTPLKIVDKAPLPEMTVLNGGMRGVQDPLATAGCKFLLLPSPAGSKRIKSKKHQTERNVVKYHSRMSPGRKFLLQLHDIYSRLHGDVSLETSARRIGQSRFRFHRLFRRLAGETLKQHTLRLRLERAAGELAATDRAISAIALTSGFASHEVFTRAFRRYFGMTPNRFRRRALIDASKRERSEQRELVNAVGPCIRLFGFQTDVHRRSAMPLLSIERKEVAPMPFLFVRRQVSPGETSATLAECFGIVFSYCMKAGLKMAGFPLARYPVVGHLTTIEAGVPLVNSTTPEGEMEYCELPGGPVVFAVHGGPYDRLGDTHAAILRWIDEQRLRVAGPHWEWYVNDPGHYPNPEDWRTHVYYPLAD